MTSETRLILRLETASRMRYGSPLYAVIMGGCQNILIPGHIYNLLEINGQTRDFEHTHSDGIVKKMDKDDPMKRVMKDEEVVAEIYLYRARNATMICGTRVVEGLPAGIDV